MTVLETALNRRRFLGLSLAAGAMLTIAPTAFAQGDVNALGTIKPSAVYERTGIAVPAFGRDGNSPVEFETIPRIIRRDLELSGLFTQPGDVQKMNGLNLKDVRSGGIDFDSWTAMGVQALLMGEVSSADGRNLKVRAILYDVTSRQWLFSREFTGTVDELRDLAHAVSDEVVRFLKHMEGIARTKFLFISEQVPGIKEVAMMDADGFNIRQLTRYGSICTMPAWGMNATEFYYVSYHGNRANVYGQLLQSGQTWPIAAYGGTNHRPAWSQTGGRVCLVLSKDGNSEIYSCGRDGSGLARITKTASTEGSPTWSPDGRRICYVSDEAGGAHLFVMNSDGSGKKRLTTKGSWNDAPAWSPDGQRIAFCSRISGRNDIFIIDADGNPNSYRRLTMNAGNNESPVWAPNSTHLAFVSDRGGNRQVYMMLDDGTNQRALTTSGRNFLPAWGPQPGK